MAVAWHHGRMPHAFVLLVFLAACSSLVPTERSAAARAAFVRANPCPATGLTRGACPGFVVDHVVPLCAGGADAPANMQWQAIGPSREKDREERAQCRELRRR